MSAATADPVSAAMAVNAIAIFFIFKIPQCRSVDFDRPSVREHRFPKPSSATIRSSGQNAVAGETHPSENEPPGKAAKTSRIREYLASNPRNGEKRSILGASWPVLAGSDVQQVVAGVWGLVGDEGESGFGLVAHQPFDRIGGAFAVVGQKYHAQHGAPGRIHGGLLELGRHHLAQAFEAADINLRLGLGLALQPSLPV